MKQDNPPGTRRRQMIRIGRRAAAVAAALFAIAFGIAPQPSSVGSEPAAAAMAEQQQPGTNGPASIYSDEDDDFDDAAIASFDQVAALNRAS